MDKKSKIYIAGHTGLVGTALLKKLKERGYFQFILKSHQELDLTNQQAVNDFFFSEKPDYVFLAAGLVGGILANNTYRAQFIYNNLMIQSNIIEAAYRNNIKKLLSLGSTCIYPKDAPQPITEDYLLTSPLEYTNEPYAIAKIAGIKLCESYNLQYGTNYLSVMPTNLYGPNDNFDLGKAHVLPALIRKIYLAKLFLENNHDKIISNLMVSSWQEAVRILNKFNISEQSVEIWGSGKPRREFLWSEDMADACIFLMENVNFSDLVNANQKEIRNTHINIGTGVDISIYDLAYLIKDIVGYTGELIFNTTKPDGTMVKLTDVSKLHSLGWKHSIELEEGIQNIYEWYLKFQN